MVSLFDSKVAQPPGHTEQTREAFSVTCPVCGEISEFRRAFTNPTDLP